MNQLGYLRADGQLGIRNHVGIFFLVGCAEIIARRIVHIVQGTALLGYYGCEASLETTNELIGLCNNPNIGGVLLVSLGCEDTDALELAHNIALKGKPVQVLSIQQLGGTIKAVEKGVQLAEKLVLNVAQTKRVSFVPGDLIIGIECGGSDSMSGVTANPAVGIAMDLHINAGGTVIFEEVTELIGCEKILAKRAINPEVGQKIIDNVKQAQQWCRMRGVFEIGNGNHEGGLTTIEEKSLGALAKTGNSPLQGILDGKQCERPASRGLYLLNNVFTTDQTFYGNDGGFDPTGMTDLAACGTHLVVFTTGRGSPTGSPILPVIKVASNSLIFERMVDNMDINAGVITASLMTLDQVGSQIYDEILAVSAGKRTKSEIMGHTEFHIPPRIPITGKKITREYLCRR